LPQKLFFCGLEVRANKFYSWSERYGKDNFHNGQIPRDHWLEPWERQAIVKYAQTHADEHYRSLTYRMLDADIVAASPATVYRVLRAAGLIPSRWNRAQRRSKGNGFIQPLRPHEHWHVDISYLNICGTFYYLVIVLDGCSRFVVHWDIRESMTELDVELVLQRAKELYPDARPRIISDNGSQFIAKEFKIFVRLSGMTHVRTSPNYPQSNGKLERFHHTLKSEAIRPNTPLSLDDARRIVEKFVKHYNFERLHSALGFVTPHDKMIERDLEIFAARDRKLEAARARRKAARDGLSSSLKIRSDYSLSNEAQNSSFH
jgi:transposase InsO family protein